MNYKIFFKHPSLCSLPWIGIFVNPDGRVQNCAISREAIGNINQEPIEQIINNDINKCIRKDMLDSVRHSRCDACYSVEDHSKLKISQSNRTWYNKVAANNVDLSIFDSTENYNLSVLDLRWRNTCNFACVYCGPDLSSNWAKLLNDDRWVSAEDSLETSKNYIFNHLDTVKHIYLAGGEPLLMKDNYELLQRAYAINPEIEIRVNSNISNIDSPVFQELKKFKNVKWTLSVDARGQTFEYMRWPGNWDDFVKNAQVVKECVGDQINFNMVWCILNPFEILDTFDFLLEQGFHENMFVVQCLTSPSPLSILHLPPNVIEQLKDKITQRLKSANPKWWLYKSLTSMYNFLHTTAPKFEKSFQLSSGREGIQGTIEFLKQVDELRGTNSQLIFKDLYNIHDPH